MIKHTLLHQLAAALREAAPQLNDLPVDEALLSALRLERPRNPEHGDYAVNVSFLARPTRMAPPKIAEALSAPLLAAGWPVTVVGGYLNFRLPDACYRQALSAILRAEKPGLNDSQQHARVLLEYVSANPTGPLHIGHGRWAALGDALVRILRHCGAFVTPEFYINDAGVQMDNITASLYWRCVLLLQAEKSLPDSLIPPDPLPYPGDYVLDLAQWYLSDDARKQAFLAAHQSPEAVRESLFPEIQAVGKAYLLSQQKALLETLRVHFESWISEKEYLYERGLIPETLRILKERGFTDEADAALWFKSTEFGDEKDRVLRKSDGTYTYLTPDIAYHDDKFKRPQGYNCILDIWGADHHGYIPRMRGAITALGHDPAQFEVLLGQLVNLLVDGERTRMGKRRRMLTLQDVVDEVGVDATRFWMVSKSPDSTLDFDVNLAASASSENPVFYVQYAHARCCSIARNAIESTTDVLTGEAKPPAIEAGALAHFEQSFTPEDLSLLFDSLTEPKERAVLNTLVLLLDGFEDVVRDAARLRAPHFLTQYLQDVSGQFHSFYNVCRILTPDAALTRVRLMLIAALRKTLAQGLDLLGVSAPAQM